MAAQLQDSSAKALVTELLSRGWSCHVCMQGTCTPTDPPQCKGAVDVVSVHTVFRLEVPLGRCDRCSEVSPPHPVDLRCWPATPVKPTVW